MNSDKRKHNGKKRIPPLRMTKLSKWDLVDHRRALLVHADISTYKQGDADRGVERFEIAFSSVKWEEYRGNK